MTDRIQEQGDSVLRLQQATRELQEARTRRPESQLGLPTDEEAAAEQRRNEAIANLRRTDMLPSRIAEEAMVSVDDVFRILYEAGLAPEYKPVAQQDLTIREPGDAA